MKFPLLFSLMVCHCRQSFFAVSAGLLAMAFSTPVLAVAADKPVPGAHDGGKSKKPAKLTSAEKFLREAQMKLENFTFTHADIAAAGRFGNQAKSPAERLPFDLLIARYHREYENRPDRAAAAVLPHLFGKSMVADWEKATAKLRRDYDPNKSAKMDKKGKDKDVDADDKRQTVVAFAAPLAPLPPAGDWQLTADNVAAAVEMAACLAAAGQMAEGLSVIDRVGADFADANRVRAAETAGDLNLKAGACARAVDFYEYGIKYLNNALGTENAEKRQDDGTYAREFSEYEKALRARLERKRDDARRRMEADQYGPDWALYRDATREEWERHNHAVAYLLYQKIVKDYPDTVYAEAARCYGVKCLLALSAVNGRAPGRNANRKGAQDPASQLVRLPPTPAETLAATIQNRERVLARAEKMLAAANRAKVAKPLLKRLKDATEKAERRIKELKAVPIGEKAFKQAERDAGAFMAANQYGLYRGEMLLAFADYWLEQQLELGKAKTSYQSAARWLDDVRAADKALNDYTVPERAGEVAMPPANERYKDEWGNVVLTEVKSGLVFNRQTTPWYWASKRKWAALKLAFIAYVEKDYPEAEKQISMLPELDEFIKDAGPASVYGRMLWNLRHNKGCIVATPEEMRCINGEKKRLMVFLADMDYENEMPQKAQERYLALLNGKCGQLSKNEKAYMISSIFGCMCWTEEDEVAYIEKHFEEVKGTVSEPLIMFGYANRLVSTNSPPTKEQGLRAIEAYRNVVERFPDSKYAEDSLFYIADQYHTFGEDDKAEVVCHKYLKKYPDDAKAGWRKAVAEILREIRETKGDN